MWFQNHFYKTKFANTCHLIITNSLFCPKGKKALTFSLDTNTFLAPGGPSVSVVMGRVRCGIYSRTALFQGALNNPLYSNRPSGISISSLGSRRKRHWVGLFFHWVFLLSCVLPIKSRKGWQALHLTGMKTLNTFYILLWQEELFILFMRDWLPYPLYSVFVNGNNFFKIFFLLLNKYCEQWNTLVL